MTLRFPASLVAVYLVASTFVVLGQAGEQAADVEFDNNWKGPLDFECPEGQVITSVYSIYGDSYHDRRFKFGCRAPVEGAVADFCRWASYVSFLTEPVRFACPQNFAIAGVSSSFHFVDRRWRFKCCRDHDYIENPCALTAYVNYFDQVMNFTASDSEVIRGWMSWYDFLAEDRCHRFLTCTIKK
ncbi:hemagglutinin/amebocyte aggregation factor-like [Elysia marginata]|uniref:Hemagglutinin/amebocyte aggregation factor-like n=1 Tax=Elysia marginata TaxID=1093978 RepID=A0AAV4JYQ0_9GAST|nr:hemagglutinin/amebocyte aggregation factor-like [Elysia marginata]